VPSLAKVVELLDQNSANLGAYVTNDPKGAQVPAFLARLKEHMASDQEEAIREMESLAKNVDHIKEIVAMQQSYARISGLREIVKASDLVDDSYRMDMDSYNRHHVRFLRDYHDVPPINVEKHKVLQILINLIRNAKQACDERGEKDKSVTARIAREDGHVMISVADNGIGIPAENLTRIFSHGFTTRKNGHGFGLHSGALAAKALGGSLTVASDGPGTGAVFTLALPCEEPAAAPSAGHAT
jgi:C4-dicarboxylate-specific signal transduction histidine kinase